MRLVSKVITGVSDLATDNQMFLKTTVPFFRKLKVIIIFLANDVFHDDRHAICIFQFDDNMSLNGEFTI